LVPLAFQAALINASGKPQRLPLAVRAALGAQSQRQDSAKVSQTESPS